MFNDERYKVTVRMRPEGEQAYEDPRYIRDTHACLSSFKERFGTDAESIQHNPDYDPPDEFPWVIAIVAIFRRKEHALAVQEWAGQKPAALLSNRGWTIEAPANAMSIAQARWVRAEGDVDYVEDYKLPTPVRCAKCGWHDFDAVPDPFAVDGSLASGRRDIFLTYRGLLVVTQPVLDALKDLVSPDFDSGDVRISSKAKPAQPLFWIRARNVTGPYPTQEALGKPCPACGLPESFANAKADPAIPRGQVVESFGEPGANIARIGRHPQSARRSPSADKMVSHNLVLSGGLYAMLFNMGFKGLAWPKAGPLISLRTDEPTWEPERRFADRVLPKEDKILKKKAPDWPA